MLALSRKYDHRSRGAQQPCPNSLLLNLNADSAHRLAREIMNRSRRMRTTRPRSFFTLSPG